jgi:hypothetical protein
MNGSANWPVSVVLRAVLEDQIGQFLCTHRNGTKLLMDFLDSVPPDAVESQPDTEHS